VLRIYVIAQMFPSHCQYATMGWDVFSIYRVLDCRAVRCATARRREQSNCARTNRNH